VGSTGRGDKGGAGDGAGKGSGKGSDKGGAGGSAKGAAAGVQKPGGDDAGVFATASKKGKKGKVGEVGDGNTGAVAQATEIAQGAATDTGKGGGAKKGDKSGKAEKRPLQKSPGAPGAGAGASKDAHRLVTVGIRVSPSGSFASLAFILAYMHTCIHVVYLPLSYSLLARAPLHLLSLLPSPRARSRSLSRSCPPLPTLSLSLPFACSLAPFLSLSLAHSPSLTRNKGNKHPQYTHVRADGVGSSKKKDSFFFPSPFPSDLT
jgi:hypothetical protein